MQGPPPQYSNHGYGQPPQQQQPQMQQLSPDMQTRLVEGGQHQQVYSHPHLVNHPGEGGQQQMMPHYPVGASYAPMHHGGPPPNPEHHHHNMVQGPAHPPSGANQMMPPTSGPHLEDYQQNNNNVMYSPQMAPAPGYGYMKTEHSAGGGGHGAPHIGSINPHFMAGGDSSSQGAGGGGVYYNNTVPTHANGERDRLFTENYNQMMQSPPMMGNASNGGQKMVGGKRIYFGGNVSMQSSNDAVSCRSPGDQPYANQIITNKLKDGSSLQGLSDQTSNNDMNQDGQSMRSRDDVLKTPSSMMGSQHNLNTSQYLLTSPMGQRKDTHQTNGSGGPLRTMGADSAGAGQVPHYQVGQPPQGHPQYQQMGQFQSPKLGGSPYSQSQEANGPRQQIYLNIGQQQRSPMQPMGGQGGGPYEHQLPNPQMQQYQPHLVPMQPPYQQMPPHMHQQSKNMLMDNQNYVDDSGVGGPADQTQQQQYAQGAMPQKPTLVCNECKCYPCPHFQQMMGPISQQQQQNNSLAAVGDPNAPKPQNSAQAANNAESAAIAGQDAAKTMNGAGIMNGLTPFSQKMQFEMNAAASQQQQQLQQNAMSSPAAEESFNAAMDNSGNLLNVSGGATNTSGQAQDTTTGSTTNQNLQTDGEDADFQQKKVITFKNRDYLLYEGRIIDESEADRIYTQYHEMLTQKAQKKQAKAEAAGSGAGDAESSMGNEGSHVSGNSASGDIGLTSSAQWKKDETMLLQYIILNVADQRDTLVENFSDSDWQTVANLVPGRSSLQCQKRWLFIQNIEGKKSAWTARETEILKRIAEEITAQSIQASLAVGGSAAASTDLKNCQPKEWTRIAEEFNQAVGSGSQRKPRQCRERWINVIDPSVRRDKWTVEEEYNILKLWRELGSKWHEISLQIEGRTEIQVKNRFNCLLKKDKAESQPGEGQAEIVDRIMEKLRAKDSEF